MNGTAACRDCGRMIRPAHTTGGALIAMDPIADPIHGYIWIVNWRSGAPIVEVAGSPAEVPASEALRYRVHRC